MTDKHAKILNELTNKYQLRPREALEELLQLEEHIHIKHMETGTAIHFKDSYYYSALGNMVNRYKIQYNRKNWCKENE
jgi:hypothetical protein